MREKACSSHHEFDRKNSMHFLCGPVQVQFDSDEPSHETCNLTMQ